MYRVVFVENMLLHGQNGKKIEQSASFGDLRKQKKYPNFQLALEPERLVGEKT